MTRRDLRSKPEFDRLFEAHYSGVWAYCRRRLPAVEVDDAVAEVFLVAWRRFDRVSEEPMTRAWLLSTAHKVVGHSLRSVKRRKALNMRVGTNSSSVLGVDESHAVSERAGAVQIALACLPVRDREVLTLLAWDELSHAEIATVLGCTENAVAIRLHRARKRLHERLSTTERNQQSIAAAAGTTRPSELKGQPT